MGNKHKLATICIQGGWQPQNGGPRVLPIIQSTTFKYDTSEEMARLFDLEKEGYFYTRLQNPTSDCVAAKIAELEGGVGAVLTSSGQAANFFAVFNICGAGDHFISTSEIYGGTYNLFSVTMRKLGIECTFVDENATEEEIEAMIRPNTKAVFGETISNPGCAVFDIEKFARIAHRNGLPLIVDNTFATPINCRPFEWGADIVTHSTTKYMDDADAFGSKAYITKVVSQLMRDLGSTPAPMNSFLLNLGLETLHLRVARHCENAMAVARFLHDDPRVAWVHYCGLEDDPCYGLGRKYLPDGSCGVLSFGLKGDRETAIKFMDSLHFIAIATHVADIRSCVLHPASHTHRQLSDEQLREAGIAPDLIRLSVGIEDIEDILADLRQALDKTFGI